MKSLLFIYRPGINRGTHQELISGKRLCDVFGILRNIPTREDTSDRGCIPAGFLALRRRAFIESAFPGFPSGLTA